MNHKQFFTIVLQRLGFMEEKKVDKFKKYLKIDNSNINGEMSKLPTLIYNYGLKEKIIKDELEDLELELEIKEAKIAAQSRVKYKNAKSAKDQDESYEKFKERIEKRTIGSKAVCRSLGLTLNRDISDKKMKEFIDKNKEKIIEMLADFYKRAVRMEEKVQNLIETEDSEGYIVRLSLIKQ